MSCQRKLRHYYGRKIIVGECYCYLCGELILKYADLSLDHIVPRKLGGHSCQKNLLPAHKLCNCEKDCMTIEEYVRFKGYVK